jgi:hypothetical protein
MLKAFGVGWEAMPGFFVEGAGDWRWPMPMLSRAAEMLCQDDK